MSDRPSSHLLAEEEAEEYVQSSENELDEEEDPGQSHSLWSYCGIGKCRPKWLQIFAKANFFTFILCLNSLIESAIVSGEYIYVSTMGGH